MVDRCQLYRGDKSLQVDIDRFTKNTNPPPRSDYKVSIFIGIWETSLVFLDYLQIFNEYNLGFEARFGFTRTQDLSKIPHQEYKGFSYTSV